ncbi:TonB-dependent receptor domain-containing protein [Rhodanobacter ginsengisoli]|uniref:TonB-dependent receptor domain-containing protein n=1 Tax=Rhodanobacter ginsengisoli TaxID=418646 RepID=A0ABW0QSC1_9GAMM
MKTSLHLRKKLLASVIGASVVAIAVAPTVSWAQTANATLRGRAPVNTAVTARNIATGVTRRTTSSADGSYALVGLPPGTYRIDAGPGTEKIVTLTVASTATLDLAAAAPAAAGPVTTLTGVTVSATTLAEVKTSEVGATISQHQIETIPQVSRNFLEFADTVPGMVFNVDSSGHTSLTGGAQNASSVNVYIDGVGQKSYVKQGGVSGQFASQGNPFPQLAIGQYKVITSNYKAEYDQISSAAVTADTKSGTNQFHGEVFGTYTNDSLRAKTPAEEAQNKKAKSHEKEYGFAVGGPIIQDKMHFFFTYEAKKFNTPITVVPGVTGVTSLLPSDVAAQAGPSNLPFTEDLYFGKIDWEPTDRDRFELSGQVRKEDQYDNIGGVTAPPAGIDVINNDTRIALRWQHSGDAYFNELLYTHEKSYNNPTSLGSGDGAVYTYDPQQDATILITGAANALATQKKGQSGPALQDDLTFNDLEWHGDHVVKMGIKYKAVDLNAQDAGTSNAQFYYNVDASGSSATPYKAFFPNPVPGLSPVAKSSDKQLGMYIQDDWAVNDKLTLNLGVRWDYERNPSYLNYVTPANVVAALNGPNPDPNAPAGQTYAQALALGGINVNDYISTGHNRKAQKNEFQPRLGFSYDLNGDEQHVIFGGAGRAYDRDLYDYLQLEQTKASLPESTVYFQDPATGQCHNGGTPCFAWDPKYLNNLGNLQALLATTNAGQEVDAINNHLKAPYSDQFSLGMRNKVGDWNTSAAVARIVSHDGFVFTLGNRYPNGAFFQNNSQPWGNGVPGFGALIIGNNGIETRTTQLLLSAEKPYTKDSGWAATFAYTYTKATQNRDINEHYSFDEATIHQYPFIDSNAASKHRFVATGTIDIPWGITLSAKLTLATPIPHNDIACYGATYPTGSACTPIAATPGGNGKFLLGGKVFGYRDVDFQATKDFDIGYGMTLYGRFDLLNAFNFRNYTDVLVNWGSNGVLNSNPVVYNPTGNITFVPRTIKFTVGMKF